MKAKKILRRLTQAPLIGSVYRFGRGIYRFVNMPSQVRSLRAGLDQHLPEVLNVVSSTQASVRLLRREQEVWKADANRHAESIAGLLTFNEEIRPALTGLLERVELIRREQDAWKADTKASADSVQQLLAFGEEVRHTLTYLLERVEFVRRETLFELRYGANIQGKSLEITPCILNSDKVEVAKRNALRLNIGCGHIPLEGYVNVDRRALPNVDVQAEAHNLPFNDGEVMEIFSSHLLEHFPQEQLRRQILPYWARLLRPEGTLRATVPDAATMIREYQKGNYSYLDLREVMFGGQDYDGDFHYNMFIPESLSKLLHEAGFDDICFPVQARRNGQCFEMEVVAKNRVMH